MSLHALDDLDDALDLTRRLLTPVDRTLWVKLAVVVFFIGGPGANLNSFQFNVPAGDGGATPPPGTPPGEMLPQLGGAEIAVIAGVALATLAVGLAVAFLGAVMEFVFVESLRRERVAIREYWGERWRQGLRLFGFRLVIGLFVFGSVLVFAAPVVLAALSAEVAAAPVLALLVVLLPLFVVLGIVLGLVNGFTTVFVVPIMVLEDRTVLGAWRRLWPTITAEWTQYLAYAVAGFVLTILGGIVVSLVVGVAALVLLVPFGLLFALGIGVLLVVGPIGLALLVLFGVLYGLALVAVVALAQVPVQTYLRYYALLVLGDIDPALDLVPDQRRSIREGAGA
jgi:hypothetical protein